MTPCCSSATSLLNRSVSSSLSSGRFAPSSEDLIARARSSRARSSSVHERSKPAIVSDGSHQRDGLARDWLCMQAADRHSQCAREDSNLHGPFSPQGPQPRTARVDASKGVQIVQIARFRGRTGRNGRGGCCHGCCHGRTPSTATARRPSCRARRGDDLGAGEFGRTWKAALACRPGRSAGVGCGDACGVV